MGNLKTIVINSFADTKDDFLEIIGKNCRKLAELSYPVRCINSDGVHWILPKENSAEVCAKFACGGESHGCPVLEILDLGSRTMDDIGVPILTVLRKLKKLKSLGYSSRIWVPSEKMPVEKFSIEHFKSSVWVNYSFLEHLPFNFPHLRSIKLLHATNNK